MQETKSKASVYPIGEISNRELRGQINPEYQEVPLEINEEGNEEQVPPRVRQPPRRSRFERMTRFYSVKMRTRFNDRNDFIKKVYAILSCQLLVTVLFVSMVVTDEETRDTVKENPVMVYICIGLSFVLLIAIVCFQSVAKTVPYNYIALLLFTLCESYVIGFLCAFYEPLIVLVAAIMTLASTIALTAYACTTKTDFTTLGGLMFVLIVSLVLFGLFMVLFYDSWLYILFCLFAVVVYGLFIIYDTQLIAGGRHDELSYDDYIIASVMLYIDIVGLFVYLLRLLGTAVDD